MGSQRVRHNLAIEGQQGTRSQMPQLKIPCATAKIWHSQIRKLIFFLKKGKKMIYILTQTTLFANTSGILVCRQLEDSPETMLYRPSILESVTDQGPQPCAPKPIKVCRVKAIPSTGCWGLQEAKMLRWAIQQDRGCLSSWQLRFGGLHNGLLSLLWLHGSWGHFYPIFLPFHLHLEPDWHDGLIVLLASYGFLFTFSHTGGFPAKFISL